MQHTLRTYVSTSRLACAVFLAIALVTSQEALSADEAADETTVSFRNDVMAVLSKAGCNMGTCHGNKFGKGGFRLSLRGDDPEFDFLALSHDQNARRANPLAPAQSLMLLKPTMQVPHEGGRRFQPDSAEYRILQSWITAGMPADPPQTAQLQRLTVTPLQQVLTAPHTEAQIHVDAHFSDGTVRDVTHLAVYDADVNQVEVTHDGLVRQRTQGETTVVVRFLNQQVAVRLAFIPARGDFVWNGPTPANTIDEHVFAKLRTLRMNPSDTCSDSVFIRRAYLDLLGFVPSPQAARAFVADTDEHKRSRLVDELLERPEFSDFWAQKWSDLLRNEEKTLDRKGVQHFYAWIRNGIATDKPIDQLVRDLITSRGSTYSHPEANYYRAMRDPLMRAESTAQLFLGVRLQCAKCHNHPFDQWTQDDYYGWANFFARVDYKVLENNRRDRNDKHEFDGEQVVFMAQKGEVTHPGRGKPIPPRFLDAESNTLNAQDDRLFQLADWLTSPTNRRFAEMQVNRIWFHLMGQGIVDPIDDFRSTNPPVNPELLTWLADDFVQHDFDLKHMIRTIMNSHTYQRSAEPNETNAADSTNFARANVRRISAEQLADSISRVTGAPIIYNGYPPGTRAGELPGVQAVRLREKRRSKGDQFLKLFGKPPRLQTCECERSDETTLSQAFQLISGPLLNELLIAPENRLTQLLATDKPDAETIRELYWAALSRAPSEVELQSSVVHLQHAGSRSKGTQLRRQALEDITWSLLNSNEFILRY